jgi:hypothetical protein
MADYEGYTPTVMPGYVPSTQSMMRVMTPVMTISLFFSADATIGTGGKESATWIAIAYSS